jgi:hypothetical protein
MKILIADILNSDLAVFHNEGIEINHLIEPILAKGESVELSFEGLKRVSTQFLNAAIGRSYMSMETAILDTILQLTHTEAPYLAEKIAEVKDNARHAAEYDSLLENA